jgi:hypothetical protein
MDEYHRHERYYSAKGIIGVNLSWYLCSPQTCKFNTQAIIAGSCLDFGVPRSRTSSTYYNPTRRMTIATAAELKARSCVHAFKTANSSPRHDHI